MKRFAAIGFITALSLVALANENVDDAGVPTVAVEAPNEATAPVTEPSPSVPAENTTNEIVDAPEPTDYLEKRAFRWMERTADDTNCISCHTLLPYAMSRPWLENPSAPSAATLELKRTIEARVLSWDKTQPWYDWAPVDSRTTEAVNSAATLLAIKSPYVAEAIKHLYEVQKPDGTFHWMDAGLAPFETADAIYYGNALAALVISQTPEQQAGHETQIAQLRKYLRDGFAKQYSHHQLMALWADEKFPGGLLKNSDRTKLFSKIFKLQGRDGGFATANLGGWEYRDCGEAYECKRPPVRSVKSDGYATGLVAFLFLNQKQLRGDARVKKAVKWLRTHFDPATGIYPHKSLNSPGSSLNDTFATDMATAYGRMALARADNKDKQLAEEKLKRRRR